MFRARGWDFDPIGVARVPLRQVLDDVSIGSGVKLRHSRLMGLRVYLLLLPLV